MIFIVHWLNNIVLFVKNRYNELKIYRKLKVDNVCQSSRRKFVIDRSLNNIQVFAKTST